ncbi:MAG TPA: hypothetical protein VGL19_16635 [Polyangiaceae bacterium]
MGDSTLLLGWSLGWPALTAGLVALAAVALAWRRFALLDRLRPPAVSILLEQLRDASSDVPLEPEQARVLAVAELNQRIMDLAFELGLLPATFTAMTRIALASGSGLALFAFIHEDGAQGAVRTTRVVLCAMSGLVGAGAVAAIGRAAKQRVARIREEWDRSSREIGKSLGTGLG